MEKFISLAISFIIITWYYINSLKFNYYFKNTQTWKFSILSVFVFTYIFFTVLFLLLDSMTITSDKEFLNFKQDFALSFILIFEIFIMIIAPFIYIKLHFDHNKEENKNLNISDLKTIKSNEALNVKEEFNCNDNLDKKEESSGEYFSIVIYICYLISLVLANFVFLKINFTEFFEINKSSKSTQADYFIYESNNDAEKAHEIFGDKVPYGLAKYAYIKDDFHKIIYFNFGLLMMFGKFLGFTYLPYGMSLMVHDMIFQKSEASPNRNNLNANLYENNRDKDCTEKVYFLNELCDRNNCNNFQKINLIAEEKKENIDEEYVNLVPIECSKPDNLEFSIKNKKEYSQYIRNKNIKNYKNEFTEEAEESLNVHINDDKKYLIKTDKSYSDEKSNRSNFFSKSNSDNSNRNDNNYNNNSLEDDSKESVSMNKSSNDLEEEEEKQNLIPGRVRSKSKTKNRSTASNGLISLENKSKNSSIEVYKAKSKSDSNKNSTQSSHNLENNIEANKATELISKDKAAIEYFNSENKETNNINERKKSENKILTVRKSKEALITLETLSETANLKFNSYSNYLKQLFYTALIVVCLITIYLIIYSKINILYSKLVYNICGVDCGFLSYRFGEKFTLDFISYYLLNYSKSKYFKLDFFFLCFILIFRMLTVYKAMSVKGVSFLWKIFYSPNSNLKSCQVFLFLTIILYTAIVLIYDFTYLIPDYLRFNGLNQLCDYTSIDKDYCGVSFFGLLFLKISMNFHAFMYFDILASGIFITTGILWVFRLIIRPVFACLYEAMLAKFSSYHDEMQIKKEEYILKV